MCGIVGYIGDRQAQPILLDGLRRLEYRGYDSAGIATLNEGKIDVRKCAGRIEHLAAQMENLPVSGSMGIGHTRWATHGEPCDRNAHPHTDETRHIALVHNGIIENHHQLREMLLRKGYSFISQTDTEAAAHLIHFLDQGDLLAALREAMQYLSGSYALAVISEREPDCIYCLRLGSPLVIGMGKGECLLASDVPAILPYTREVIFLEDGEIAILRREGVRIFNAMGEERPVCLSHIPWDAGAAEKEGYPHFMLKEIHEQPRMIAGTLSAYVGKEGLKEIIPGIPSRVDFIACGTAYHAGCLGAAWLSQLAGVESHCHIASEYRYRRAFIHPGQTILAISQSGETADTLAALQKARQDGAETLCLTNTLGSTIHRSAEKALLTYAGPEIAVASTKAYTTQAETLLLAALDLARKKGMLSLNEIEFVLAELKGVSGKMNKILEDCSSIQHFCDHHLQERLLLFIGRGVDYALAMEGALKLKEISYLPCQAYAAGELKHGAIALIEKGTPVIAICTQERLLEKTLSNLRETKARGAETICICPEAFRHRAEKEADILWLIPDGDERVLPLLAVLPLQLLAYYMAVAQGRDVDKPRNLAKSVTVE